MGCPRHAGAPGLVDYPEVWIMRRTTLFALLVLSGVFIFLIGKEAFREKRIGTPPDGCVTCHQTPEDPSPSHSVSNFGCAICHLGNPYAREKERAHLGLAANPGNLRNVRLTCGQGGCHPDLPGRVENSLMATNRGILAALQSRWPHNPAEDVETVNQLAVQAPGKSMALDHYRKMCGGCHLWKTREPWKGEIGKRGGGCSNCHVLGPSGPRQDLEKKSFVHPKLTTRIPNDNCLKCHNRSARNALSYLGRFESEGYGTPFEAGGLNSRRLSGGRFYLELHPDIHKEKAGMDCIDCHTERGLMGDGNSYVHMNEQVDITCNNCHDPKGENAGFKRELADRLLKLNGKQPSVGPDDIILSSKGGSPLYHVRRSGNDDIALYRKRDGKEIKFKRLSTRKVHEAPYHDRLSCQACHSEWMPQCYGCHVALLKGQKQKDWLTGEKLPGRWVEGRSYLRFRKPTLGIWPTGQIGPFAPGCQVFLDVFDEDGRHQPEQAYQTLTMAGFDPHTTGAGAPKCVACHLDPKRLGLGEGALKVTGERLAFSPTYDSRASGLGIPFPLDAFVSTDGESLQKASRDGARPFNRNELLRITHVSKCLFCHDTYDDPIYNQFDASVRKFRSNETPCKKDRP